MSLATDAIDALERLRIAQGRLRGEPLRLAGFQRQFIEGGLANSVSVAALSVGRGNGKTGLAVTHLLGDWAPQPQREVTIAARTWDPGAVAFGFCCSFIEAMPELDRRVTMRKSPLLEIEIDADDGPHLLKVVPSTSKAVLGGASTLAILDERTAWMASCGAELEAALLTSLGKRDGRATVISSLAPDDGNDFSRWFDTSPSASR